MRLLHFLPEIPQHLYLPIAWQLCTANLYAVHIIRRQGWTCVFKLNVILAGWQCSLFEDTAQAYKT